MAKLFKAIAAALASIGKKKTPAAKVVQSGGSATTPPTNAGRINDKGELVGAPEYEEVLPRETTPSKPERGIPSQYVIKNHILYRNGSPVMQFQDNFGGTINPVHVTLHHTCSYTFKSTINTFLKESVSVHLVLGKEKGEIAQGAPFNKRCGHAGESYSAVIKKSGLNGHSIGIEVVNIGPLTKVGEIFRDFYKQIWKGAVRFRPILHGYSYWEPFTEWQEVELIELCATICLHYNIPVSAVEAHYELTDRKNDPYGGLAAGVVGFRESLARRVKELRAM